MKKIQILLLIALFNIAVYPATLIHRSTLETKEGYTLNETPVIDTAKFRQLRVLVKKTEKPKSVEDFFYTSFYAVENSEDYLILSNKAFTEYSTVIDTPPTKIKIKISGQGKFEIFVWAS